jgi:hypothetical protein
MSALRGARPRDRKWFEAVRGETEVGVDGSLRAVCSGEEFNAPETDFRIRKDTVDEQDRNFFQ